MKKSKKIAALLIAALLLCSCKNSAEENTSESDPSSDNVTSSAEPDISDIPGAAESSDTTDETVNTPENSSASDIESDFTDVTDITELSNSSESSASSDTTTEISIPDETTSSAANEIPELDPDSDSGDTLTVNIDLTKVSYIKYTSQQIAMNDVFSPVTVSLTNSSFKNQIGSAFNGLLFVSVSLSEKSKENDVFSTWKNNNPNMSAQAETLVFLDKNGKEIIRFTTELSYALSSKGTNSPLTRATVNGIDYDLFYGDFDYDTVKYTLLNQTLVSRGFFTLATYAEIAKTAVKDELDDFETLNPDFRVYSPDAPVVLSDGTVKYPSEFSGGTLLVDCSFFYPGNGKVTVTMNALGGSVIQTTTTS